MKDHIILHKSIIDDWKFKDEGVLKFWILLLVEELESQKDKEGLFAIRNLTKLNKKASITRQKAHRLLKKMEVRGDIDFLSSYFRGGEQKFWNMNGETTTKISINKNQTSGHFTGHKSGHFSTEVKTNNEAVKLNSEPQKADILPDIKADISFAKSSNLEEIDWEEVVENIGGHKSGHFSTEVKTNNEANIECFLEEKADILPDIFYKNTKPEIKPPPTKEEEERAARRIALRSVLKEEIGYLCYDETVNSFFNELSEEYDGSPDKEIQLAVRKNLLRKIHGSFKNTLEIRKAELYAKNKDYPIILSPRKRVFCSTYLDRELLKISKIEKVQYDEQKMIKINIRGPRKIGDVAKELVGVFTGHKSGHFSTEVKTSNNEVKIDSEPEKAAGKTAYNSAGFGKESTSTESDSSDQFGTELALKSINEVNTILNTNIKNISTSTCTSTVQENLKNNFVLDKRGCGGEKGKICETETPGEKLPLEKKSTVAENHPDGRPNFSTRAFKSLPKAKQVQIISERLSEIAEMFPTIDVEFQFDHWKDWMDAKGKSFKDYSAAFRNWLRKSLDFAAKNSASNPTKIYTETGAKFVTQEVFTNPAHVPFKKDVPRNPNLKRQPGIGGVE